MRRTLQPSASGLRGRVDAAQRLRARAALMLAPLTVVLLLLGQSGADLNATGEALLARGQYRDALRVFRRAAELNPRYAAAVFNQALAMAGVRRESGPQAKPSKKSVLDVVEQALKLDPKLAARAAELPAVNTTYRGQRLLGRTPAKNTADIVQALTWRSRDGDRLQFLPGGAVRHCRCRAFEQSPPPPTGQWTVDGDRVTVVLAGVKHEGVLAEDGVLTLGRIGRLFSW